MKTVSTPNEKIIVTGESSTKIITRRANGSKRVASLSTAPSMTDKTAFEETDINNIVARYEKTGMLPMSNKRGTGIYADVSNLPDLLGAAILLKESQDIFDQLPSRLREKFKNSPQNMIDFISDPKNQKEALSLGLIVPLDTQPKNPTPNPNDDPNDDTNSKPKTNPKTKNQTDPSAS